MFTLSIIAATLSIIAFCACVASIINSYQNKRNYKRIIAARMAKLAENSR